MRFRILEAGLGQASHAAITMALVFALACQPSPQTGQSIPSPEQSTLSASPPTPSVPDPKALGRHVVLVSIDGLRPDYYTHADAYALKIPNLRSLMARGRYAEGVIGTWPTVTYPAHTTLVTGARPNKHGVLANHPFDPLHTNRDGWNWYAESIHADALWDAARRAGKTSGSVYWPVTVGAAIDHNFPQIWRARVSEDDKLLAALATPGLVAAYTEAYGATLPAETRTDHERANGAELLLRKFDDDLTLVYLTDLDNAQHAYGPGSPEALATLERIDTELGRILNAVAASSAASRTAVVVVSDHGFAKVSSVLRLGALFREAGLIDVAPSGRVRGWQAGVLVAGGLAGVYLRDPNNAAASAKVASVLADAARRPGYGIQAVLGADALAKEGGFLGASFALQARAGFEFSDALEGAIVGPSGDRGAHGYPPENEDMHASLLAAGAGIRPGPPTARVSMLAVAPTVARLLGVTLRDAEARPLDDWVESR